MFTREIVEELYNLPNFQTQTHTLIKNVNSSNTMSISKNLAESMLLEGFQKRTRKMSNQEVLERLQANDNVIRWRITFARRDIEREIYRKRDKQNEMVDKLGNRMIEGNMNFNEKETKLVLDNLEQLFQHPSTRELVKNLLTYGEEETCHRLNINRSQFKNRVWRIVNKYIPNHRDTFREVLAVESKQQKKFNNYIIQLANAHEESESKIQEVIENHKKLSEKVIGECDTPYIHNQVVMLTDYPSASKEDKQALVRYLIKLESRMNKGAD